MSHSLNSHKNTFYLKKRFLKNTALLVYKIEIRMIPTKPKGNIYRVFYQKWQKKIKIFALFYRKFLIMQMQITIASQFENSVQSILNSKKKKMVS
jgi:hypothetical protein